MNATLSLTGHMEGYAVRSIGPSFDVVLEAFPAFDEAAEAYRAAKEALWMLAACLSNTETKGA